MESEKIINWHIPLNDFQGAENPTAGVGKVKIVKWDSPNWVHKETYFQNWVLVRSLFSLNIPKFSNLPASMLKWD